MTKKDIFLISLMSTIALVCSGCAIWFYWNKLCCFVVDEKVMAQWGQTGDFFGGILNPFFTFIGLIFVIITIKQNEKSLQTQTDTAELQRFENTFFKLIEFHKEITDSVSSNILVKNESPTSGIDLNKFEIKTGRFAIEGMLDSFKSWTYWDNINSTNCIEHHNHLFEPHSKAIDRYFKNIFQIFLFIDKSKVENKKFYTNLFSSQFSSYELEFLFCYCAIPQGIKLKPFIEKYSFFEYLPLDRIIAKELAKEFKPTAFGENEEWQKFLQQKLNNQ